MTSHVNAEALIILLHGVGQYGHNMLTVAEPWRDELPNAIFAAPDAPFVFERGVGRQWFSAAGITDQNRPGRIAAARSDFNRVIQVEIERHGFADRLDEVVLVGFSQGAMMLIDAVVTGRWRVASAVAFSGRLTSEPLVASKHPTKLLLLQGGADRLIPPAELRHATDILKKSGFAVESHLFPDMGHIIAPEAARAALEFLRKCLATPAPSPSKEARNART